MNQTDEARDQEGKLMAESDSTSAPAAGNAPSPEWRQTVAKRLGFDLYGALDRLDEASPNQPEDSRRQRAVIRAIRWLVGVERMHGPENIAAWRWADALKTTQAQLRSFILSAARREREEADHRALFAGDAPHMDSRVALAGAAGHCAKELLDLLVQLREAVPAYKHDSLPPADSHGGLPPLHLLANIELELFDGGFSVDEIDALVARNVADNPLSNEQTRQAAHAALRKRVERAGARRDTRSGEEAEAIATFLSDPGNARALAAWEADATDPADTTPPPGTV